MKTTPIAIVLACIIINISSTIHLYGSIHMKQWIPLLFAITILSAYFVYTLLFSNNKN